MHRKRFIGLIFVCLISSCSPAIPHATANPATIPTETTVSSPTPNAPTRPDDLLDKQIDAVIASYRDLGNYPFTKVQIERITQAVDLAQVQDEKPGLTRWYWLISQSKLVELQALIDSGAPYISCWGDFPDSKSWLETVLGYADASATSWTESWQEKPMFFEILRTLFKNYAKAG